MTLISGAHNHKVSFPKLKQRKVPFTSLMCFTLTLTSFKNEVHEKYEHRFV